MSDPSTSTLLRLSGLPVSQLPAPSATSETQIPFLHALLAPAIPFLDSAAPRAGTPSTSWTPKGTKRFKVSAAAVETSARVVDGELARRAFTPGVVDSREGARWEGAAGVEVDVAGEVRVCEVLCVQEMRHAMPGGLLRDRVFGTVMVAAAVRGRDEFVVVSVPLRDLQGSDLGGLVKEKGIIVGAYVSVERIRRTELGQIEWLMATASDAKGVLPMWVQTRAVVGVVAKDVELFLSWIADRRDKGEAAEWTSTRGAGQSLSFCPEATFRDMNQSEPTVHAQRRPLFLSGQPQQQGTDSCETLLSHQSEYPRNATELAISLVNLVFPYDVRNTQRSLARMYDRVKAVEAKASIDSAARQQAERAMGALEKEMTALQAMVAKSQPDPSEHMRVEDLEKELRQKHEKMIEMVSEFNTQRESLLADVNRLVDQTRQIQQEVTARSTSITEEPIVPSEDMHTYPGEAAPKVATTATVPEKSVEAESIKPGMAV
ncbi:hypothetical protein D7B24_002696 [Verticillium nonalfalfae]|uniref:DUF3074 domain-containing protein n=1 Tax=Verticillium nonalfalfae TaxID=1051616 RepID=A0A3M9YI76_9PEZI|nr:uncharacterized protein D7B24_002696 [Verticillium nonalfalfae]RNJ59318.1 hypothetical protein D7B24_002696 [Verticillium nonalfalfae]